MPGIARLGLEGRQLSRPGLLVLVAAVAGCASKAPSSSPPPVVRDGRRLFRSFARGGTNRAALYGAFPGVSGRIVVRVRRAGPLAAFGHNHVVSTRWFSGIVRAGPADPGAVFCLPLANLSVDRPALRRRAGRGFGGTLSPALRQATDRHMLESLDAREHPDLLVIVRPRPSDDVGAGPWAVSVVLDGHERPVTRVRTTVRETPDRLAVRADFRVRQTRFGVHPYSVLGGLLRVRNRLAVRVRLTARRLVGPASLVRLRRDWCAAHPPHLGPGAAR